MTFEPRSEGWVGAAQTHQGRVGREGEIAFLADERLSVTKSLDLGGMKQTEDTVQDRAWGV